MLNSPMNLGTAPLFDLPASPADEAAGSVPVSRSQELLASIRDRQSVIADQQVATLREIAAWAAEHVVADDAADIATLTERGLDTGLPVAGEGAPLISDFAVMEALRPARRRRHVGRAPSEGTR